jgi:hypothetical protein
MDITPEELDVLRKLTSEVKKINENNIVYNRNTQRLYVGGSEFHVNSYSLLSTPDSEFTEIKLLVNFDKPIGEQL